MDVPPGEHARPRRRSQPPQRSARSGPRQVRGGRDASPSVPDHGRARPPGGRSHVAARVGGHRDAPAGGPARRAGDERGQCSGHRCLHARRGDLRGAADLVPEARGRTIGDPVTGGLQRGCLGHRSRDRPDRHGRRPGEQHRFRDERIRRDRRRGNQGRWLRRRRRTGVVGGPADAVARGRRGGPASSPTKVGAVTCQRPGHRRPVAGPPAARRERSF